MSGRFLDTPEDQGRTICIKDTLSRRQYLISDPVFTNIGSYNLYFQGYRDAILWIIRNLKFS